MIIFFKVEARSHLSKEKSKTTKELKNQQEKSFATLRLEEEELGIVLNDNALETQIFRQRKGQRKDFDACELIDVIIPEK